MAHPVGICQASTVFSYRSCCGRLEFTHLNFNINNKLPVLTFVLSLQLAFAAAILNIKIPLMLGDLVNVVAQYLRENTRNYVQEISGPALKLLALYGLQVSTDFQHFNKLLYPRFEKQFQKHIFF